MNGSKLQKIISDNKPQLPDAINYIEKHDDALSGQEMAFFVSFYERAVRWDQLQIESAQPMPGEDPIPLYAIRPAMNAFAHPEGAKEILKIKVPLSPIEVAKLEGENAEL